MGQLRRLVELPRDLQIGAVRTEGEVAGAFFEVIDPTDEHPVDGTAPPGGRRFIDGGGEQGVREPDTPVPFQFDEPRLLSRPK